MTLSYTAGPGREVVGTYLHEDVVVLEPYEPEYLFVPGHPVKNGTVFTLTVVEEDRFSPDDDLGSNRIHWNENGVWQYFDENDDDDPDLEVKLVWCAEGEDEDCE